VTRAAAHRDAGVRRWAGAALTLLGCGAALTGCGELNRTVTLGTHTTALRGAAVAAALRAELAGQGAPAGQITCARKVAVYVGIVTTCHLVGPTGSEAVTFKFSNGAGQIEAASVRRR
jgi:hypothetical protein